MPAAYRGVIRERRRIQYGIRERHLSCVATIIPIRDKCGIQKAPIALIFTTNDRDRTTVVEKGPRQAAGICSLVGAAGAADRDVPAIFNPVDGQFTLVVVTFDRD